MFKLKNSAMLVVAALCGYLALMTPDWKTEVLATSAYINGNDQNGDGNADVLLRHSGTGEWFMAELSGLTINQQQAMTGVFLNVNHTTVSTADFDGDGDSDILTRGSASGLIPGRFRFEYTNGVAHQSGVWATGMSTDLADEVVSTDDFDQDGIHDVLTRNTSTGVWNLYLVNGTGGVKAGSGVLNATTSLTYTFQGAGDYNGDTYPDLLVRADNGGNYGWILYTLDGSTTPTGSGDPGMTKNTGFSVLVSDKDFNGDGVEDVLMRGNSGTVQQWFMYTMNGLAAPTSGLVNMATQSVWQIASDGDFNGDGKADIMLRSTANGQWFIYLLDGRTILSSAVPDMLINPVWELKTIDDHNGDNRGDIMLRNSGTGQWLMHLMNGTTVQDKGTLSIIFSLNYDLQNNKNP